uniref:OTU domain-containing protein n=1 Tax=Heterorhabditis bacteriophora TaxID=37862 RepID=A0A1I7WHG1_HETBA
MCFSQVSHFLRLQKLSVFEKISSIMFMRRSNPMKIIQQKDGKCLFTTNTAYYGIRYIQIGLVIICEIKYMLSTYIGDI